MTQPVDDLLKDLDEALDIEPSSALTASVRARIGAAQAPSGGGWVLVSAIAAVLALTAYVSWPGDRVQPLEVSASPPKAAAIPLVEPRARGMVGTATPPVAHVARLAPRPPASSHPAAVVAGRELDVIVEPSVRAGVVALAIAAAEGRVSANTFPGREWSFEPVVFTPFVVVPLVIDVVPADVESQGSAGGGVVTTPPTSPLSRTGSVL